MWRYYDALIKNIDDSMKIKDFAVGTYWTGLLTDDGSLGIAPSIYERYQRFPFTHEPEPGMPLSEFVSSIKSWNYSESSLALAAINAYYNRESRVPKDAEIFPGGRRSRGVFQKFCEAHTKDKHSLFCEPMYERDESQMQNIPGIFDVIRRDEDRTYRDFIYTAYRELMPGCDQFISGGRSFVTKLAGPIFDYAAECKKDMLLWGIDVPYCEDFFKMGFSHISAFIVDDSQKCLNLIKRGATREDIIRFGHFFSVDRK